MHGGKGDLFGKRSPFPPGPPNPSKNFYSGRYGRSPSGGHRAWHRALPSGEALGTRWHLSRRPARTQWPGRVEGSRAEMWGALFPLKGCAGGWRLFGGPGYVSEEGRCQSPSLFSMDLSPKNTKACVPAGTQAVQARLGKEGGSLRGEGNRLCALAKGVPFPPQQNHSYRA